MTADNQDVHRDMAQALQAFWEEYTGICPARQDPVVWLEEALSPAERQMASTHLAPRCSQGDVRYMQQRRPCGYISQSFREGGKTDV